MQHDSYLPFLQVSFKQDVKCEAVCTKNYKKGNPEDVTKLDFLKMGMQLNYQHHWFVHLILQCAVIIYLEVVCS